MATNKRGWKTRKQKGEYIPAPPRPYSYKMGTCPACGESVVLQPISESIIPVALCNPQRRLIIFDRSLDDLSTGKYGKLLALHCEMTGYYGIGREATDQEKRLFSLTGNPGKPYLIGRVSHISTCSEKKKLVRFLQHEVRLEEARDGKKGTIDKRGN